MHAVWAIAIKDLRLLLRDRSAAFFTLVFPLLFGVGFGLIFQQAFGGGGDAEIAVAIVDLDDSELSREYADALVEMGALTLVEVADAGDAENRVRLGRLTAGIVIPEGFEEAMQSAVFGEPPTVEVVIDPSRSAEAGMLQGVLAGAGFRTMVGVFQRPEMVGSQIDQMRAIAAGDETMSGMERVLMGTMLDAADRLFGSGVVPVEETDAAEPASATGGLDAFAPVEVTVRMPAQRSGAESQIRSAFELTYPQAAAWALVGCVTGFGMSLVGERSSGTLKRLAVAPIRRDSVVFGKALACFLAALGVLVAQRALFALPFFGVRGGEPWVEAVTIVLIAFAFVGVMMVLSTVMTSAGGTDGAVRGTLLVLALLGGAGVPLMFFTGWLGTLTMVSPFRWAITALEGSTWRGWSPDELAHAWGVLGGIGVLGMILGIWRFRCWSVTE